LELNSFPKRGEIHLVCLDPTLGSEINKTRPAIVISNDINNEHADTITVIPITSNCSRVYPFEVLLHSDTCGLINDSKAKCDQIRTIDKRRFIKAVGKASEETIRFIEKALSIHLGLR